MSAGDEHIRQNCLALTERRGLCNRAVDSARGITHQDCCTGSEHADLFAFQNRIHHLFVALWFICDVARGDIGGVWTNHLFLRSAESSDVMNLQ